MDEAEQGIVAVITNHSWLRNPTFRGMRQSLIKSFNQIISSICMEVQSRMKKFRMGSKMKMFLILQKESQ
jgi:predicted helicase